MRKNILIIIITLSVTSLFAGPFGLDMGMNYDQVKESCGGREPVLIAEGRYLIIPDKLHPYFTIYVAWIDELEGLTYIKAIGESISTNGYGLEIKNKFNSLEQSLCKNYGTNSRTDYLMYKSIWDEPRDWMSALESNERKLYSLWSKEDKSTLPEGLVSICLIATAENSTSGSIILEYEFSNHQKAQQVNKEKEDSVF